MSFEPSAATTAAILARRRARGRARRAVRKAVPKTKFTGAKPSIFLYGIAIVIAALKDLLDYVGVGSLPAIGTMVTICFNILIFLLLTVFDNSGGWNVTNRAIMRGLVLVLVSIVEGFAFGLNFVPWETFAMIGLYLFARHAWKKAKKESDEKGGSSEAQSRVERMQEMRQAKMEEEMVQQQTLYQEAANQGQYQEVAQRQEQGNNVVNLQTFRMAKENALAEAAQGGRFREHVPQMGYKKAA